MSAVCANKQRNNAKSLQVEDKVQSKITTYMCCKQLIFGISRYYLIIYRPAIIDQEITIQYVS